MTHVAVCLLSGGLDSTAAYKRALLEHDRTIALTIVYGQRHSRELESAKAVVKHFGDGEHVIADLPDIGRQLSTHSALTGDGTIPVPSGQPVGIPTTYVPLRNAILLSCAGALLESVCLEMLNDDMRVSDAAIVYGAHREDWVGYPDCTPMFVRLLRDTLAEGSKLWHEHNIALRIDAPFLQRSKADIARSLTSEEIDLTWSCYNGGTEPCQTCPTCISRAEAIRAAQ